MATPIVIDADGHVYEGNVDLASRMPEKWRSQAPIRLRDNEGNWRILLEGRLWSASQGLGPGVSGPMTDKARGYRDGMVAEVATSWCFAAADTSIEIYGTEGTALLSGVDIASRPTREGAFLRVFTRADGWSASPAPAARWRCSCSSSASA